MKKRVILGQLGWSYSDEVYLPLSAGMLAARCHADSEFNEQYEIDPFLRFARDAPEKIVLGFEEPPDVLGLSMYVWCERISLEVAQLTKKRFPHCLVVLGGPSVSDHHYGKKLLYAHPYVDVLVHGEGEETFLAICKAEAAPAGTAYLDRVDGYVQTKPRPREKNLDLFPSPFLTGVFDRLFKHPAAQEVRFAGVWEADRGCPFACT